MDGQLDADGPQALRGVVGGRVIQAELEELARLRQAPGRVLGIPPVDEERQHAAVARGQRIREAPGKLHAVRPVAAADAHGAEIDPFAPCRARELLEVGAVRGPRNQPRALELVNPEYPHLVAGEHLRVRPDDLEVTGLPERDEGIARAVHGMVPAGHRIHAEALADLGDAGIEVRRGEHEVIDYVEGVAHNASHKAARATTAPAANSQESRRNRAASTCTASLRSLTCRASCSMRRAFSASRCSSARIRAAISISSASSGGLRNSWRAAALRFASRSEDAAMILGALRASSAQGMVRATIVSQGQAIVLKGNPGR